VLDVALHRRPGRAEHVVEPVRLALQVGLGVRSDRPLLGVLRRVRAAREPRQLAAPGVAQHVHEEQPILGARVAEAEHRPVARRAVDVRHAEALVAHDRDVRARRVAALYVALADPERRVLEEAADLPGLQPGRRVDEVAVHAELVAAVRHRLAGAEEREQLGRAVVAARAGREDVAEAAAVVGAVSQRLRRRRAGNQRGDLRRGGGSGGDRQGDGGGENGRDAHRAQATRGAGAGNRPGARRPADGDVVRNRPLGSLPAALRSY
jgi:hypothetical protein